MSIKLLLAAVNPVDPSPGPDVSTSLVPLTQRAITARARQISLVPSADAFASSSTRRGANPILGTTVEDSQNNETARSGGTYLSGWGWSHSVERTAIAHYLFYAAGPAAWSGQLIDLYA